MARHSARFRRITASRFCIASRTARGAVVRSGVVRTARKLLSFFRIRFDPEPDICPTAAFEPDELSWPRVVRRAFSDPRVPHESTGVEGRGTEEVKTNDISGRVKAGEVGFTIEFGRPGVGVWFHEIQKMTRALARAGVSFEKKNPITSLMTDLATGTLREDIMNEKILSAIVEIKVTIDRTEEIIRLEDDSDTLNDKGIKALFKRHRDGNAMDYIVGIEIYDHLEKVMDRFEDLANRISGIVIEHA